MNPQIRIIKSVLVWFSSSLALTAALGQTYYTWTGAANGTNLPTAGNWTTNGLDAATNLPNGANGLGDGFQDAAQWDGRTTTNLLLTYPAAGLGWPNTGFGSVGVNLVLTANQTNDVQIVSPVPTSAGVGVNHVTNNSPDAAFIMGDSGANNWLVFGRPAGVIHYYVNNSTAPATINPSVKFQAGGGAGYTYQFGGTGNWIVNSYLTPDNNPFSPSPVTVDGPGTVVWFGGKSGSYNPNGAGLGTITINGGILILKSDDLFTGAANQAIVNNATLIFDAPSESESLSGVISGTGVLIVTNGTLSLSGQSTYSGDTLLNGGTLVVNGAESVGVSGPLGVGGTISFNGGTLQFRVNNVADYSSRFSTAAGQAYRIDTDGQNVTIATGLTSSGGTLAKLGNGTLTLGGTNSYSGATAVSLGKLVFQGRKTGSGSIAVEDNTALGVFATDTQVTPATLTFGTSSGATLEFNNVNSTTTAPLAAGTVSAAGTVTVNINSGSMSPGNSYPLLAWTSGSAPGVSLGVLNGFIGNLSTNGSSIQLNITATAFKWTGITGSNWDLSTANNWQQNGGAAIFANGGPVFFDDTSTRTDVTINALVQPTTVTVSPETNAYAFTSRRGNKKIGGSASLTKSGNGSLTLSGGANTYSGVTTVSGGTLRVAALAKGGAASDVGAASSSAANLVLDGGTLQYTGAGASINRLFTLGTSGGTIDSSGSGALILNNTGALGYSGNGPRSLTLTGTDLNDNTLAAPIANNGGASSLTKNGAGKWVLTGANTYSGVTTISGGTLQVGAGGDSGSFGTGSIVNDGTIIFNRTGILTVNGAVGGTGSITKDGSGTVILANNNAYGGGTTITAGTLQVGSGGATGSLNGDGAVANEGTLIFNSSSQPPDISGVISGSGNLIKRGSGTLRIFGANTYTGNTTIESGTLQICAGILGASASPLIAVSNNATLLMVRQDYGGFIYVGNIVGAGRLWKDIINVEAGDVTLTGMNTYTGGTFIAGGGIILGDGINPGFGSIVGNVIFTNSVIDNAVTKTLIFNRPDDYTFSGNILGSATTATAGNRGGVVQNGLGVLKLTGNSTYPDGTTVNAGKLLINGTIGAGTVTVNGGTLGGTGTIGGSVDVTAAGTLAPGVSVGTLTIASNLNIAGNLLIEVNKSLSPSNDLVVVSGGLTNTGAGTLTVSNFGAALVVGDKFTLFNKPVEDGEALTVTGAGVSWANNLAVDGSISVSSLVVQPTLSFSQSGNGLEFSWTGSFKLQAQTNNLSVGMSTTWADYPGGGSSPVTVPIDTAQGTVFFRLSTP